MQIALVRDPAGWAGLPGPLGDVHPDDVTGYTRWISFGDEGWRWIHTTGNPGGHWLFGDPLVGESFDRVDAADFTLLGTASPPYADDYTA